MTAPGASARPGAGAAPPAPAHVAIIMDGNGRWAHQRNLPRVAGHRQGIEAVQKIVRAAGEAGVGVLTLYAFSSENWRRPAAEISYLMGLLVRFIDSELEQLHREGVRLQTIGDIDAFAPEVRERIARAKRLTADNDRMTLVIALNYGARAELAAAARALATAAAEGRIDPVAIDEAAIDARLETAGLPPLDLLIRTSGEVRLSNFLLWQAAYAELYFTDTLWPDFDEAALGDAFAHYAGRHRRFGGL